MLACCSYIVDNYDRLPSVMIFQHANRYQWHNDDPLYGGQRLLSQLQLPFVKAQGCANLRCVWTLGCYQRNTVISGKDAVHCPNAKQCYCDVYGICDLDCESEDVCRDQYTLPKSSVIPNGWPEYDWDGIWQNVTQLRLDHTGDLRSGE